ncbi:MAG: N-acetyltransferase family protein [Betaproteobacteria bacterium]
MTLLIRPSRDEDAPVLAAIYANSVATESASWEYEAPSAEEFARRRREVIAKGFPYLVAEWDGAIAGYCYASSFRARIGYRFVVEDSVYVLDEMKGRGIGKKLLTALIDECAARGYRQMVAVIGDSANLGSIKLHAACGFEHAALFKGIGFKFGRWLDSVQMQRALGEGSETLPV